ncbi:glutathione S-transferase 3-like isoform X2 [Nyctibius grandis]|uniref:glutathione S-transferase 3-like isoform X2 n=1 Tax=Nyctibius grandis TaxID=48427 RepID=UPI0035BBFA3D
MQLSLLLYLGTEIHHLKKIYFKFEGEFLENRDESRKLLQDGALLFQQVPMVRSCEMSIVQPRAILSHTAGKVQPLWEGPEGQNLYFSGNKELRSMSGKPRLTYFNGRGRMESIRWLLAAAGVEFQEIFFESREQYEKLIKDGVLMFQQVPLVEIDGMKMVQTRAILSYIAGKYNLYGKDLKERALIDMYVEGITDLMQMILMFPFSPPEAKEKTLDSIKERATNRYFPVFEKVLKQHGQDFLVGNKFSWADVQLIEAILAVEENIPGVLSEFPLLQCL